MSRAPDFSRPVLGFRAWSLGRDGTLGSVARSATWEPGVNEARCTWAEGKMEHQPPDADCSCGFYAFHDDLDPQLREHATRFHAGACWGPAVGAIAAWGEMEVHWNGFRAQRACITALAHLERDGRAQLERLELAAERYGVELVPITELAEAGQAFAAWLPGLPVGREERLLRAEREREAAERAAEARRPWPRPATGIWLRGHVGVRREADAVRVSPTRSLAALLAPDTTATLLAAGSEVEEGSIVAVIRSAGRALALRSPVPGSVIEVNESFAAAPAGAVAARSAWVARIEANPAEIAEAPVAWGRGAAPAYRAHLRTLGDDAGLLDSIGLEHQRRWVEATSWGELGDLLGGRRRAGEEPLPDAASVVALAPLLGNWIAADRHLSEGLGTLGGEVRIRVTDREVVLVLGGGGVSAAAAGGQPAPSHLALSMDSASLHRYLCGELDLARALGLEVGLEGSRTDAMMAGSLLQRLFVPYRAHFAERAAARRRGLAAA